MKAQHAAHKDRQRERNSSLQRAFVQGSLQLTKSARRGERPADGAQRAPAWAQQQIPTVACVGVL